MNLGCSIDLVYRQGAGSGFLRRERVLLNTPMTCVNRVLNVPLTIKTRTGVYKDKNVAHTLVPRFEECGVSSISVSVVFLFFPSRSSSHYDCTVFVSDSRTFARAAIYEVG